MNDLDLVSHAVTQLFAANIFSPPAAPYPSLGEGKNGAMYSRWQVTDFNSTITLFLFGEVSPESLLWDRILQRAYPVCANR